MFSQGDKFDSLISSATPEELSKLAGGLAFLYENLEEPHTLTDYQGRNFEYLKKEELIKSLLKEIENEQTRRMQARLIDEAIQSGRTTIPTEKWGVHESHCCKLEGCKYGAKDCPVVLGLTAQESECEECLFTLDCPMRLKNEIKKANEQEQDEKNFKETVAKILKDNITFSGQVGDYIIHGALEKIWELHKKDK